MHQINGWLTFSASRDNLMFLVSDHIGKGADTITEVVDAYDGFYLLQWR
jgi:hypothetical protein